MDQLGPDTVLHYGQEYRDQSDGSNLSSLTLGMLRKALHHPLHPDNGSVWALALVAHLAASSHPSRTPGHTFLQILSLHGCSHPNFL